MPANTRRTRRSPVAATTPPLDKLKRAELQARLQDMGLSTQGNKPELLARLQQARGQTITRPTPAARARPSASPPASAQRQPAARASSRPVPVPPVDRLTAQELLGELTRRGLATTGTAAVLRARLQRHYEAEARRQSGATGFEEQIGAFEARLPRSVSQASAELPRTASQATARSLFSPGSVSSNESFSSAATHRTQDGAQFSC